MGARGSSIRAGAAFIELKSKDNGFSRGLKRAQRRLDRFGATARKVGAGLVAGGGSIVVAGAIAARIFARMGDELDKASKRTGFTVEALSELGFAAEQSGADLATLEKGIKSMQRSINDAGRGLSTQVDALNDLGLGYKDLASLSPEDQFALIAERLSTIEDPGKRAALAMQLLGRAGQKLLPLFEGGAGGMEKLRQQARDLGIVVSTEAAAAAAEMTDELNITKRVIKALVFEVGAALAPAIIKATKVITQIVAGVSKWVKKNQEIVRTVVLAAGAIVGIGGAIIGLGIAAAVVAFAFGGLASAIAFVGTVVGIAGAAIAFLLTPIGLIAAVVVGVVAIILTQTNLVANAIDFLGNIFGWLGKTVGKTLGSMVKAITSGNLKLAIEIAVKGMQVAWMSGLNKMESIWIEFQRRISRGFVTIGIVGRGLDKNAINSQIDQNSNSRQTRLQDEINSLIEELRVLNNQTLNPNNPAMPGFGSKGFVDAINGFTQASTRSGTSARGVFQSAALKSLASPVEKSIEENTAKTALGIVQLTKAVRNGGLRFT